MASYPHQCPSILPQGASRPLSEEIKELPRQYLEVLTKPGVATFAAQMGKANWRIVWVQLLGWGGYLHHPGVSGTGDVREPQLSPLWLPES